MTEQTTTQEPATQESTEQASAPYFAFHLISGSVVYQTPQPKNAKATSNPWGVLNLNGILKLTEAQYEKGITVSALAMAQNVLRTQFYQKTQDPQLVIGDIIINNIELLNFCTEADFYDVALPDNEPENKE